MGQQLEIRTKLYHQFLTLVHENPSVCVGVFEVLQPQLAKYLEAETVPCPFHLDRLYESTDSAVELVEPLPALLLAIFHSYLVHLEHCRAQGVRPDPRMTAFRKTLDGLIERLLNCSLEDYSLDKNADYSGSTNVGLVNAWKAWILLRFEEVAIEYVFLKEGLTRDSGDLIIRIFHHGDDLREALRKGSGKKKVEPLPSVLSLRCVASLSSAIFGEPTPSKQQGRDTLSEDDAVIKYIVQLSLAGVQSVPF